MHRRLACGAAGAAAAAVSVVLHVYATGVPDAQAIEAMEKFLERAT